MSTQPIVDPMIFYKIGVFSEIEKMLDIVFVISVLVAIWGALVYVFVRREYGAGDEGARAAFKFLKKAVAILVLITVLVSLTPSEKTMYSMLVADAVTPANIKNVGGTAEECIDYIFEKADDLINAEEEKDE